MSDSRTASDADLRARFRFEDRRVWFGRAGLTGDRIVLKGLFYSEEIALDDIIEIRWIDDRLTIVLDSGDSYPLILRSAALWKYELQARCGLKDDTFNATLPDKQDSRPSTSGAAMLSRAEGDSDASSMPGIDQHSIEVNRQFRLPYGESDEMGAESD